MFATFEGKDFVEESSKKVEEFARDLVNKPKELYVVLELLSKTHSTHGHLFGYIIGNCVDDKEEFINKLIDFLNSVSREQMDESVLGGFLFALRSENSDLVSASLEKIAENPQLCHLLLSLTARTKPEKRDLDRLIDQLKKGTSDIEDFQILQYGSALAHLNTDVVTGFFNDLLSFSSDGCPVVFDIAYMYTFNNETKLRECIPFFKKILIDKKCFYTILKNATPNHHILYSINQLSTSLLQQKDPDPLLAAQITEEIIELCLESPNTFGISHDLHGLITLLISPRYVEITWPILGDAIISRDYRVYYCLKDIIGGEASCGKWNPSLLEGIPLSLISKWCEENREKAPYFLAEAILPLIDVDKKIVWCPLAEYLLNNYGDDEEVLSGLTHKMHEYSWMGSQIPFYETWLSGFNSLLSYKNSNVKQWAEKNIEYVKRMIQETKTEEDERELYRG
jgi:hypothetical protein